MATAESTRSGTHAWMSTVVARTLVLALIASVIGAGPGVGVSSAEAPSPAAVVTDMVVDSTADTSDADQIDGLCDDGTGACTIRAAVEQANATGGALTIGVPAGTYLIATKIEVTGDVTLHGAGIASTILSPATNSTPQLFQLATGASFAAHGITFDSPAGRDPAVLEIVGTDASLHVADSEFLGGDWAGIFVDDTAHRAVVEVLRSRFADVEYPIFLLAGEQVFELRDSLIERGGYSGLFVDTDGGRFSVIDSQIVDTPDGGSGIEFWTNEEAAAVRLDIIRSQISRNTNQGVRLGAFREGVETFVVDSVIEDSGNIGMWLEGDLTITDSIFRNNPSDGLDHSEGSLTVTGSTFTGNGAYGLTAYAGSSATIVNTTISDNGDDNGDYELFVGDYDVAEITNVTATGPGHGLGMYATSYNISNSVFHGGVMACDQPYSSVGHNADTDGTCGFDQPGDLSGIDPLLGPLGDNGGPTTTHEPTAGSPLIDAGSASVCPVLDQRGATRPADGNGDGVAVCDIGAVEAAAEFGAGELAVTWEGPAARRGLLRPDGDLAITVTGAADATSAMADVDVMSWYPSGDTTATLLDAPAATTVSVPLTATDAGTYTGQLPLEGIATVTAIDVTLETAAGTVTDSTTERLPVDVAGALEITTELAVPAWALPTPRVWARSASTNDGDSLAVDLQNTVTSRWLEPASDYEVEVADSANRVVVEGLPAATVRAGLMTPVSLAVTPLPYIPLTAVAVDANTEPVAGVQVTITDQATGDQIAKATTGSDGRVPAMARGPVVVVTVDPLALPYTAAAVPTTLTEIGQEVAVAIGATLPTAVVSGVVDHPDRAPVPGARVSLTTVLGDGRSMTTATTTGEDGTYTAEVFQGEVTAVVDLPRTGKASETAPVTNDTTIDLMLVGPLTIDLTIDLRTKLAEEDISRPVDIDGAVIAHTGFYVKAGGRIAPRPYGNVMDVVLTAGDPLQVCATGHEAQLGAACADAVVDLDTQTATASLELTQTGRVEGQLTWTAPSYLDTDVYRPSISGRIFRVEDDEHRTLVRDYRPRLTSELAPDTPQTAGFSIGIFEPGTYEFQFTVDHFVRHVDTTPDDPDDGKVYVPVYYPERWVGSQDARIRLDVPASTVLALGDVPFQSSRGQFSLSPASSTTVSPTDLLPGGTAAVRVAAHNTWDSEAVDVRLRMQLPTGATLIPDSVTLDGQPVTTTAAGDGTVEVAAGSIAPDGRRVVVAWVQLATDIDADQLIVPGSVAYGTSAVEPLGVGVAAVRRLSLQAERRTATLELPVWGRALPGSIVVVDVAGAPAATTTASAGGFWQAAVQLPASPLPRSFDLQARTASGAGEIVTPRHNVDYDPTFPKLQRVLVRQTGGRVVEIDPRDGVATFPYVWVPSEPFLIDLEFDYPDRVTTPVVHLGTTSVKANLDAATGVWQAELRPTAGQLGKIRVQWEPIPQPLDLAPAEAEPLLPIDQARAALPPTLATFTDLHVIEGGGSGTTIAATFPDLDGATLEVSASSTEEDYTPTAEDLDLAASVGAAIYDVDLTVTPGPDDSGTITMSFFVPDTALNKDTSAVAIASDSEVLMAPDARQVVSAQASGAVRGTRALFEWTLEHSWTAATSTADLSGGLVINEFLKKLNMLGDAVVGACDAEDAATFRDRIDRLGTDWWVVQGLSATFMLLGVLVGPASLGLGTVAITVLTEAVNRANQAKLDTKYEKIKADVEAACAPPEPEPEQAEQDCESWPWFGAFCDDDVIGDPVYVHDPSGYVYELFEDNRLEGVTATVQTAATPDGPWTIWDAAWFGQDNPLVTDTQGAYGWDVPEGWWRVRWDAEGYATAFSDALEVLPPHFDVNVALESLSPPVIANVSAVAGDSHADVTFETSVDTAGVEVLLGLVDGDDVPVEVAVTAVDERDTDGGAEAETVATTFRLELGRPLVEAEELSVVGDRLLSSYAGVPAGTELVSAVEVSAAPPVVPAIGIGDVSVAEGDTGSAAVQPTVTLSKATTATVTVDWVTVDGTATAGSDYVAASGTLVFPPGMTSRMVAVTVTGDTLVEPNERFRVRLSNPQQATIGDGSGTVTIIDDDEPDDPPTDDPTDAPTDDPTNGPTDEPTDDPMDGGPTGVSRSAGADRILTAVQVSRDHWPDGRTASAKGSTAPATSAVLARADLYSDALAAGPFAADLDAPLLLTHGSALPEVVAEELERLGVTTVWLLGGSNAISPQVEARLEALGYRTERIAGPDRFATAAAVAARVGSAGGQVVLALGSHAVANRAWPDALSAGALSASPDRLPVLLTGATALPHATIAALTDLDPTTVWVLGGSAAIPDHLEQQLNDLGYASRRLAGADRYQTSVQVATQALTRHGAGPVPVVFATGGNFPDGLAAAALAARLGGIVLLVPTSDLDAAATSLAFLQDHADILGRGVIVGGQAAVSEGMRQALAAAM